MLSKLSGHTDAVRCVAAADNGHVLTGSKDETVKVWRGDELVRTIEAHIWPVMAVAVLPGCARFVSGSIDETAKLFTFGGELERTNAESFPAAAAATAAAAAAAAAATAAAAAAAASTAAAAPTAAAAERPTAARTAVAPAERPPLHAPKTIVAPYAAVHGPPRGALAAAAGGGGGRGGRS